MLQRCKKCGLSLEINSLLDCDQICDCREVETYNHTSNSSAIYVCNDGRMWMVREISMGDYTAPALYLRGNNKWLYITTNIMVIQEITEIKTRSVRDDYKDHYPEPFWF